MRLSKFILYMLSLYFGQNFIKFDLLLSRQSWFTCSSGNITFPVWHVGKSKDSDRWIKFCFDLVVSSNYDAMKIDYCMFMAKIGYFFAKNSYIESFYQGLLFKQAGRRFFSLLIEGGGRWSYPHFIEITICTW